ncbi:hypothetical protein A946_06115 [Methylacidiphilum kamchatkense Kam1]|uniref:Uncharacterized protein n=1 Tax=Methylacidiphilum kamchatkense Kam1 TaxID=1202785 RepID=A0ABR4ZYB5_9BACT|nr:hypothetical protein A946_06115 [Methylacidiphilum kamchatkense Kam1]
MKKSGMLLSYLSAFFFKVENMFFYNFLKKFNRYYQGLKLCNQISNLKYLQDRIHRRFNFLKTHFKSLTQRLI